MNTLYIDHRQTSLRVKIYIHIWCYRKSIVYSQVYHNSSHTRVIEVKTLASIWMLSNKTRHDGNVIWFNGEGCWIGIRIYFCYDLVKSSIPGCKLPEEFNSVDFQLPMMCWCLQICWYVPFAQLHLHLIKL